MTGCSNQNPCACTYSCEKRHKCCECVAYHRKMRQIPGCFFSAAGEKTYDRSYAAFIAEQQHKS
ncbi:MAG TPA: hypothetical protein PLM07_17105 [Candidatus Rifleibacterium sp.]|nr:hypothetical protein [Candidatus Rifleibacterium sp.]HPT47599.1 hypothetical protein [Candidatus Rifleibacterium sp.]